MRSTLLLPSYASFELCVLQIYLYHVNSDDDDDIAMIDGILASFTYKRSRHTYSSSLSLSGVSWRCAHRSIATGWKTPLVFAVSKHEKQWRDVASKCKVKFSAIITGNAFLKNFPPIILFHFLRSKVSPFASPFFALFVQPYILNSAIKSRLWIT